MEETLHTRHLPGAKAAGPAAPATRAPSAVVRSGTGLRRPFVGRLAVRFAALAACALLWEAASRHGWTVLLVRFENIPPPSVVARAGWDFLHTPKALRHIVESMARIFAGFGIATALAVTLGLLIGRFRLFNDMLLAPLELLRPIPAVAWIPLAILMFATAEQSMVFITFVGAFFPILLATIHGVENIDRRLVHASLTLGADQASIFREVVLPGSLPSIVTGLSIGMGTAWFSLVTAEMVSGQFGIGYYTWEAYTLQNYPDIVLGMAVIGILGMGSSVLVRWIGGHLTPWHQPGGRER